MKGINLRGLIGLLFLQEHFRPCLVMLLIWKAFEHIDQKLKGSKGPQHLVQTSEVKNIKEKEKSGAGKLVKSK